MPGGLIDCVSPILSKVSCISWTGQAGVDKLETPSAILKGDYGGPIGSMLRLSEFDQKVLK